MSQLPLIDRVRAVEVEVLGASVLPERMIEGIVKQAGHAKREDDPAWIAAQIRNHHKVLTTPLAPAPKAKPKAAATAVRMDFAKVKPTPGRHVEVAIKFDAKPHCVAVEGKKVALRIEASGFLWDAVVSKRQIEQVEAFMEQGQPFVGVVRGQLGAETSRGFVLDAAGLSVFAKQSPPKMDVVSDEPANMSSMEHR